MSASSSVLLPALYSIQKDLHNMQQRYGSTVLDKESGKKQIPASVKHSFFYNLTQNLLRYNILVINLRQTKERKVRLAVIFYVMLILGLAGIVFGLYMIVIKPKLSIIKCEIGMGRKTIDFFSGITVGALIILYILIAASLTLSKNLAIYDKVYQTPNGDDDNQGSGIFADQELRHILEMYTIKGKDIPNGTPDVEGGSNVIKYLLCKNKGWHQCGDDTEFMDTKNEMEDNQNEEDNNGDSEENKCKTASLKKQINKIFSDNCGCYLYDSCLGSDMSKDTNRHALELKLYDSARFQYNVDPYLIFRKLQKYDVAFQVARISDAVAYFKTFLLKEKDLPSASTLKTQDVIINGIVDLLSINFVHTMDFKLFAPKDVGTVINVFTATECHSACISQGMYIMSSFDAITGTSTLYTKEDIDKVTLLYNPSTSLDNSDLVIKFGSLIKFAGIVEKDITNVPPDAKYDFIKAEWKMGKLDGNHHLHGLNEATDAHIFNTTDATIKSFKELFSKQAIQNIGKPGILTVVYMDIGKDSYARANMAATFSFIAPIVKEAAVNFVRTNDTSMSFQFSEKNIGLIKSRLGQKYDKAIYAAVSSNIASLIDSINIQVERLKYTSTDAKDPKAKYISYDRFMTKMGDLTDWTFINEFMFYIDEMRHTSMGLKKLYDIYDYSSKAHEENRITVDIAFYFLLVIFIIIFLRNIVIEYHEYKAKSLSLALDDLTDQEIIDRDAILQSCGLEKGSDVLSKIYKECPIEPIKEDEDEHKDEHEDGNDGDVQDESPDDVDSFLKKLGTDNNDAANTFLKNLTNSDEEKAEGNPKAPVDLSKIKRNKLKEMSKAKEKELKEAEKARGKKDVEDQIKELESDDAYKNIEKEIKKENLRKYKENYVLGMVKTRFEKNLSRTYEIQNNKVAIEGVLRIFIAFMIFAVIIALFYAWKQKNYAIFEFNMMTLDANGNRIVSESADCFNTFVDDYIIPGKLVNANNAHVNEAIFDELDDDVKFHVIQQYIQTTGSKIRLSSADDLTEVYDNLIDIIDKFDKCNILLFNMRQTLPFPFLEVFIYFFLIVILVIISIIIVIKLKPHNNFIRLRVLFKLKEKLNNNIDIAEEDLDFCMENDIEKVDAANAIKMVAVTLLPVFTVLFAMTIMNSSDDFASALYTSTYFRNLECYNLKN